MTNTTTTQTPTQSVVTQKTEPTHGNMIAQNNYLINPELGIYTRAIILDNGTFYHANCEYRKGKSRIVSYSIRLVSENLDKLTPWS